VRRFVKHAALLVTRYDRTGGGDEVRRVHQEDFCKRSGCRRRASTNATRPACPVRPRSTPSN
jgi:hypothetical protein